jgi:integrase
VSGRTVGHRGLDRAAAAAAAHASSAVRERQLWWVAGELARALQHEAFPLDPGAEVQDLFELEATTAYLALGASGELRVRATGKPNRENPDTTRMRRTVLGLLAEAAGTEARLPRKAPRQPAKAPVPPRPREMLRETLADLQERTLGGGSSARLRMLAIGGMVTDTGARAGELVDQDLDDLHPGLRAARVRRRPQGTTTEGHTSVDAVPLLRQTTTAVAAWLDERGRIIDPAPGTGRRRGHAAPLQGSATALWVSIRSNHGILRDGEPAPRPAGTPLGERGLGYAWSSAVDEANQLLNGEPGWTPLPARMEQLRRGVTPARFQDPRRPPRHPDAERAALLLDRLTDWGRQFAAALNQDDADGQVRRCRTQLRVWLDDSWFEGIDHRAMLRALDTGGLRGPALAQAGWHPALLRALDLAARHGRTTSA